MVALDAVIPHLSLGGEYHVTITIVLETLYTRT